MKDLELTFGEIFNYDYDAFQKHLLRVQRFRQTREESEEWVKTLRLLDISDVPDFDRKDSQEERPSQRRRVASRTNTDQSITTANGSTKTVNIPVIEVPLGKDPYIAVSWRWKNTTSAYGYTEKTSFDYRIQREEQEPHKSDFPNHYLERVVRFAQSVDIPYLWVDKESIYQREEDKETYPKDRELGVQIMDVVYGHSAFSVGLLSTALINQREIDMLFGLIEREVFLDPTNKQSPELRDNVNPLEVQMLILRIISDPRFSRGWIFQEDHLSSDRMVLLIPHSEHLNKDKYFGSIPGELQVNLADFKQAATMFCVATGERWPTPEILGRVKQYNIWNKRIFDSASTICWNKDGTQRINEMETISEAEKQHPKVAMYPSSTSSILEDILSRSLFKEEDRVAILANAARFPVRLDITNKSTLVKSPDYSLSTALLALVLLNGEILTDSMIANPMHIFGHTLQSYLDEYQCRIHAPTLKFEQSFINHCRLRAPKLTKKGIETQGYIFGFAYRYDRLVDFKLTDDERKNVELLQKSPEAHKTRHGRILNPVEEKVIEYLITKMQGVIIKSHTSLHEYLQQYLDLDRHPPKPKDREVSTPYILKNMSAIAQAMIGDQEVRLAALNYDVCAIFVPTVAHERPDMYYNEEDDVYEGSGVFTSWDNGYKGSDVLQNESLASLEIGFPNDVRVTKGKKEAVHTCRIVGWINGIWDARGKKMKKYTFPIPGFTDRYSDPYLERLPSDDDW